MVKVKAKDKKVLGEVTPKPEEKMDLFDSNCNEGKGENPKQEDEYVYAVIVPFRNKKLMSEQFERILKIGKEEAKELNDGQEFWCADCMVLKREVYEELVSKAKKQTILMGLEDE